MVQIDQSLFKQLCMKNLDLVVREHSPSAATTPPKLPLCRKCDPFQAATGAPHSVLFGAWILLRPACNSMRGRVQECIFLILLRLQTLVSDARNGWKVANSLMLTTPWANMAKSRSTMSSLWDISKGGSHFHL